MKKEFLFITSFLLLGCGGGGDNLANIDIRPLIKNKTYYEDDLCNKPQFRTYTISDENLTIKSFNDADFSDLNSTQVYFIQEFTSSENLKIQRKDGKKYQCVVGYEVDDKKRVSIIELDCFDPNGHATKNDPFVIAFDTKEKALEEENPCNSN